MKSRKSCLANPAVIAQYTEVSSACACEMADRVRRLLGVSFGVSTTGYAGPGGGTSADPVGTVYIAVSSNQKCFFERFSAPPTFTRSQVRSAAAARALELVLGEIRP